MLEPASHNPQQPSAAVWARNSLLLKIASATYGDLINLDGRFTI
jgi:hypothetical protein